MNCNGKWMKPIATCLIEAQQREIIANLSKPNAPSKWVLGREYKVSEGAIRKISGNPENILQRTTLMFDDAKSKMFRASVGRFTELEDWQSLKVLKLYTTMSSILTTNCFAPMFTSPTLQTVCPLPTHHQPTNRQSHKFNFGKASNSIESLHCLCNVRATSHKSQEPWPWNVSPKESVQRPSQNNVVWLWILKCSVKPYVTGPSTKCYFNECLFTWVLTHAKIK